jgi:uncharacterized protein YgbK (DUF1537 family)
MLERETVRFADTEHVMRIVRRILAPLGRRLDESNPMVDARLPDGGRINVIIEPLAIDGLSVSIRKFRKEPLTPADLVKLGTFDAGMAQLLEIAVRARCNILVSGGTSSGKTSLLNALASFIPQARARDHHRGHRGTLAGHTPTSCGSKAAPAASTARAWSRSATCCATACACGPTASSWAKCAAPKSSR